MEEDGIEFAEFWIAAFGFPSKPAPNYIVHDMFFSVNSSTQHFVAGYFLFYCQN
jgi:hypothetical protein